MSTSSNSKRRLLKNLGRGIVSLALLAYVVSQITWKDRILVGSLDNPTVVWGWLHEDRGTRVLHADNGETVPIPADMDETRLLLGFPSLLKSIDVTLLLLALAAYPIAVAITARRWQWLLQTHGLDPGFWEAVRLTWMGLLTNNVLPGSSGGDVVKAVCIYRRTPTKRLNAVMTVFLDRILGLVSMMLVGGIAIFFAADSPEIQQHSWYIPIILLGVLMSGMIFFSGRIRRVLRVAQIIDRLPFTEKIQEFDQSVFHFRQHPWTLGKAIAISLPVHLGCFACVWLLGLALGLKIDAIYYCAFLPVILTAGAMIPAIGGLGVLEGGFQYFFSLPGVGATPSSAVALCIVYRFMIFATSLPGAIPFYREFSTRGSQKLDLDSETNESKPLLDDSEPIARCSVA